MTDRERFLALLETLRQALGQHLIAERGLPVPSSYREIFTVLGTSGVLDGGLAGRLQGWGGLRNLIAHQYGSLNLELVAHALYEDLGALRDFATAMAGFTTED